MKKLTVKQQETLLAIHNLRARHGYTPTLRELMSELRLLSTASVQLRVKNLIEHGYINRPNSNDRSLEFTQHIEFEGVKVPVLGVCD